MRDMPHLRGKISSGSLLRTALGDKNKRVQRDEPGSEKQRQRKGEKQKADPCLRQAGLAAWGLGMTARWVGVRGAHRLKPVPREAKNLGFAQWLAGSAHRCEPSSGR